MADEVSEEGFYHSIYNLNDILLRARCADYEAINRYNPKKTLDAMLSFIDNKNKFNKQMSEHSKDAAKIKEIFGSDIVISEENRKYLSTVIIAISEKRYAEFTETQVDNAQRILANTFCQARGIDPETGEGIKIEA